MKSYQLYRVKLILGISFLTFVISACYSQTSSERYVLTPKERHYCDSLKLDSNIIVLLRKETDAMFSPFPTRIRLVYDGDKVDSTIFQNPGFILDSNRKRTVSLIDKVYFPIRDIGYTIFTFDNNYGIEDKPDLVAILKSTDKLEILKQVGTDGLNWGIDNDSLVKIINQLDQKYALDIIGAGSDWCEFKINSDVKDWKKLAKEVYKVCPDIVEQGTETLRKLAEEMERRKKLYFWWD